MIFFKIYVLASKIALLCTSLVSDTLCSTSPCAPRLLTAIPINASRIELKNKIFVMLSLEIPYLYYYQLARGRYSSCAVVIAKLLTTFMVASCEGI
jgi:hypothetical protein